jgi:hypothetical protein
LVKRALQDELDEFFKAIGGGKVAIRVVTKSVFSQARLKLKHHAFIEMNQAQVACFYQQGEPKRWHGYRLLAMDGSMSDLPNSEAIRDHFGVWHPQSRAALKHACLSYLTR